MHKPLILLVEDDPTQQFLIRLLCARNGLDLKVAANCAAAVSAFETNHFDLVLMDWKLGEGDDGLVCTKKLRRVEGNYNKRVPIIAVTACALNGDREICLDAGMDDYIAKPFSIQSFAETVQHWLQLESTLIRSSSG